MRVKGIHELNLSSSILRGMGDGVNEYHKYSEILHIVHKVRFLGFFFFFDKYSSKDSQNLSRGLNPIISSQDINYFVGIIVHFASECNMKYNIVYNPGSSQIKKLTECPRE